LIHGDDLTLASNQFCKNAGWTERRLQVNDARKDARGVNLIKAGCAWPMAKVVAAEAADHVHAASRRCERILSLLRPVRDAMSTRKKIHDFIFPSKIPRHAKARSRMMPGNAPAEVGDQRRLHLWRGTDLMQTLTRWPM